MVQAVILCGGLGPRLREETEFRPKPMVRIGELRAYRHDGVWTCMDTQWVVDHLNQLWETGKAAWCRW